jgi:DNA repair exonuclease SbcCD ATPase subunit
MKLLRIQSIGLGGRDVEIDFTQAGPVACLFGENGAGKTTAFEAVLFALFGKGGSYSGSIADNARAGGDGRVVLSLDFEAGGKTYRVERDTRNAFSKPSSRATLEDVNGPIAGPNIGSVNAAIESLIGSHELALATWAAVRGAKGDLTTATGGDFTKRLGEIIGLDRWQDLSETIRDTMKDEAGALKHLDSTLATAPDWLARELAAVVRREDAKDAAELAANAAELAAVAAARAAAVLAQVESAGGADLGAVDRYESAKAAGEKLAEELARAADEHGKAQRASDSIPGLTEDVAALTAARANIERLEADEVKFRARDKWTARKRELIKEQDGARRELAALEATPGADAETIALAGTLEAEREAYKAALDRNKAVKERNDAAAETNRERADDRAAAGAKVQVAKESIRKLEARIAAAPVTPGEPDVCRECPLLKEFVRLPKDLESARESLAAAQAELAAVPADLELEALEDLAPIHERGAAAANAAKSVKAGAEAAEKAAKVRTAIKDRERTIDAHNAAEPPAVADPTDALREARRVEREKAGAEGKLERATADAAGLHAARERLSGIKAAADKAKAEIESLKALADAAKAQARDALKAVEDARKDKAATEKALADSRTALADATKAEAQAGADLRAARESKAAHEERRAEAEAKRETVRIQKILVEVFGATGIQSTLLDHAAAPLEDAMNSALDKLAAGELSALVRTQSAGKDGVVRADAGISILDSSSPTPRNADRFSGGEGDSIRAAARAAVLQWAASNRGATAEAFPLFVDEAGGNMDDERVEDFARTLQAFAPLFSQVLAVTPRADVAALFESRITLEPVGVSGVAVSYEGGK